MLDIIWLNLVELSHLEPFKDLLEMVRRSIQEDDLDPVWPGCVAGKGLEVLVRHRVPRGGGHPIWPREGPQHLPEATAHPILVSRQNSFPS